MCDRILVVRLGALGDVVRTLPAVSMLRRAYPRAHIAWLVEPGSAGVLERQPWLDEVLVFPRPRLGTALRRGDPRSLRRCATRFLRDLRGRRFDLVLDFHGILRSAVLSRLSGAPRRVGYGPPFARELSHWWMTDRARLAPQRLSRFARNTGLVEYLGIRGDPDPRPLRVDPERRARMAAQLAGRMPPVALHPGTSARTSDKRYPVEGYARVARRLAEDGVPSIVTAGPAPGERALAEALVALSRGAARLAPPTPSLPDLAALYAVCRLYVGGDTGPLHVASLVGTPVVQLLGPTDPIENEPWPGTPYRTVRAPARRPPGRRGRVPAAMPAIPAQEIVRAARDLLAGGPGPRAESGGAPRSTSLSDTSAAADPARASPGR